MSREQFYMVYNPNGKTPKVQHATHAAAKAEAQRLAALQPNDQFYILRSRGAAVIAETPKPDVVALAAALSRAIQVENMAHDSYRALSDHTKQAFLTCNNASRARAEAESKLLEAERP